MSNKKWIKIWAIATIMLILIIGGFNYLINPYGIYKTGFFNFPKIIQASKMRLIKAIKIKKIKPKSICLGSSRAEGGYDPAHKYFLKPSFNLALSQGSMYENRLYFEHTLKQGNLKKVLLVADYIMFSLTQQKTIADFETYFDDKNIYSFLFSIDTLKDSLSTIKGTNGLVTMYYDNGQRIHNYSQQGIDEIGGHLEAFKSNEAHYYEEDPDNYIYPNTKLNSFDDFEKIIELCYDNNIELDIIFGASHIRQWEALNFRKGLDKWLKWKKDVVISVDKIATQYSKKQFRIMDFSVYHALTAEKVPTDKNTKMKYYWESSHYKNELGLITLNRLMGNSEFEDFGIELNLDNIDTHLEQQKIKRNEFMDIELYQKNLIDYLN